MQHHPANCTVANQQVTSVSQVLVQSHCRRWHWLGCCLHYQRQILLLPLAVSYCNNLILKVYHNTALLFIQRGRRTVPLSVMFLFFYIFSMHKLLDTFYTDMEEAFSATCCDGWKQLQKGRSNSFTFPCTQKKNGHKNQVVWFQRISEALITWPTAVILQVLTCR